VWPADRDLPEELAAAGYRSRSTDDALAALLADHISQYPEVEVRTHTVHDGLPADALIAAADNAHLIVVGSHDTGGLRGLLLGSVSRTLIDHAPCPVAVIRQLNPDH
jgi:nucleotide-binding universal stress UspA family protein